ncbi:calponin homology domain-containing protein DDB_G0272472-like [Culex pipiens pallens]|uniref:calponin homology domain-containing protein DDB_G0272472-like n=1 Tax=Culex pipiens pallens TaxID=42434 RepID=UPI001953AB57|nr:calponin homology domain-containing protein DDB_G0272472-like [Culex pipiens pallens]
MIKELFPPVEPKADTPRFVPANGSPANCGGGSQKALVLTANKWKQLLSTATGGPSRRPETAHTVSLSRHKQYLKEESQAMTRKWENTVQNIREKKEAERVRKQLERVTEDEKHYRELQVADEVQRKQLIQKAEEMIQKEKEGPRVLESTAKLCEVLKAREQQRKFRTEQEALQEARRKQLDQQDIAQANRWLMSHAERHIEDRRRFDGYKKELKQKIEQDREEQRRQRNFMVDQERKQHQALQDDINRQLEQEKSMFERNKEARRKLAIESMRMAQEREERLKRESAIEDTLNQIYNEGQKTIAEKRKEIHVNKHKFRDNTHLLKDSVEKQEHMYAEEAQIRDKVIKEKEAEALAKERERIEQLRQAKFARIQAHLTEMEWKKQKEAEQAELERKEMADRLKNLDVTFGFDRRKVTAKTIDTNVKRKLLLDQADEKEARDKKAADTRLELQFVKDDAEKENKHFLKYADELVSDAKAKGRPVLPLLKTVQGYKREHYFDFKEQDFIPRHLVSRVPINNKLANHSQQCQPPVLVDDAIIEMTPAMPPIRVRYDPEQLKHMNPYKNQQK